MIKTVNSMGRYMMATGGLSATTYVNSYSGSHGVGNVRFNTGSQNLEVFDGSTWVMLNYSHASVGLTPDAEYAIEWAIKKQREDMELEHLAKSNTTIADLVSQKKEIDDKIKMVQTLIRKETKVGTN